MEDEKGVEKNSRNKVVFSLANKSGKEGYIGEFYVTGGELQVKGVDDENRDFLLQRLQNVWVPQQGLPVLKKDGDRFAEDEKGHYIVEKYVNATNASPDELVEAIYDYTRALGIFRVELIPV